MTVQDEIRQRIEKDALLARLRRKIDSGNGTYADSFAYSDRAGKLLGEVFSRRLPDIPLEEREALCVELLRDRYTDINALCDRVQKALDEAQGLHLAPQHAPFNGERAHQIGSSLRDLSKPVEILQRRAESAPATATRAMHDDRMEAESKFRSRAGLKCWITRKTDGKCCEWCSKVAGRYEYGEEPDDIYRRHDNCGCSVTFENGRQRQDVWSKREWEVPKEGAGAGELVNFIGKEVPQKGLTILSKNATIEAEEMFRKAGDDPLLEVFGKATDSHPEEVAKMITRLQEMGVEIHYGQNTLGYGCIRDGVPGTMSITDNASIGAWLHEFDHAEQDMKAGWNGLTVLWFDPAERERRERAAYSLEIQLARKANREDIVKRLEANRDEEIRKIWHDYHERFGYSD